jgi:hypothetical protein
MSPTWGVALELDHATEAGCEPASRSIRRGHGLLRSLTPAQRARLRARAHEMRGLPEQLGEPEFSK